MIARECPEQDHAWRRHAAPGDNDRMPVPSRRLKDLIEGTVDHHASQRWPALEEVTISWRGSYGYLTGYLSDNDDDTDQALPHPVPRRLRRLGLRDLAGQQRQLRRRRPAQRAAVGAENSIHVTRPDGIRRSGHRREPVFGRCTDQGRSVRAAVSAVPRRAASGEAGASCGGSRTRARSAGDGSGSRSGCGPGARGGIPRSIVRQSRSCGASARCTARSGSRRRRGPRRMRW